MSTFFDFIYTVTAGLLVPCLALLIFFLIQALMVSGRLVLSSRQDTAIHDRLLVWLRQDYTGAQKRLPPGFQKHPYSALFSELMAVPCKAELALLISEFETRMDARLNRYLLLTRLGPMLGLIGTLLPMGPALQGLANGDIQQLASQMQVAFTTTVVGLLIGGLGMVIYSWEKRWITRQLVALDYLAECTGAQS